MVEILSKSDEAFKTILYLSFFMSLQLIHPPIKQGDHSRQEIICILEIINVKYIRYNIGEKMETPYNK